RKPHPRLEVFGRLLSPRTEHFVGVPSAQEPAADEQVLIVADRRSSVVKVEDGVFVAHIVERRCRPPAFLPAAIERIGPDAESRGEVAGPCLVCEVREVDRIMDVIRLIDDCRRIIEWERTLAESSLVKIPQTNGFVADTV